MVLYWYVLVDKVSLNSFRVDQDYIIMSTEELLGIDVEGKASAVEEKKNILRVEYQCEKKVGGGKKEKTPFYFFHSCKE